MQLEEEKNRRWGASQDFELDQSFLRKDEEEEERNWEAREPQAQEEQWGYRGMEQEEAEEKGLEERAERKQEDGEGERESSAMEPTDSVQDWFEYVEALHRVLHPDVQRRREVQRAYTRRIQDHVYGRRTSVTKPFQAGTNVMRRNPGYVNGQADKPRFIGPYEVREVLANGNYRVRDKAGAFPDETFHHSELRECGKNVAESDYNWYYIREIAGERQKDGGTEYYVRWFGFGDDDGTWQKEADVPRAVLREYWAGRQ